MNLGEKQQLVLELRRAHNPIQAYGFVGVALTLKDLSAAVWLWHRAQGTESRAVRKIIEIPAEAEWFYPDSIESWMVKLDANPVGGLELAPNFFLLFDKAFRAH